MHVRMLQEAELKVSATSTKKWPKDWAGEVADELAVQMILLGLAADPKGEVTREALEAEVARMQAEADGTQPPPAPDVVAEENAAKPVKRPRGKKPAADSGSSDPQA